MVWEKLQRVSDLVEDLEDANEACGQLLEKYSNILEVELGTSEEWKDVNIQQKHFVDLKDELSSLQKKASGELFIVFVGSTSGGKSSLINCLLREDRLPVDIIQSTMCSIHVRTTPSSQWKVLVDGKPLEKEEDKEAVRRLLNKMNDLENWKKRKDLKITKRSVVEVFWPKDLCTRLPENVVLVDTPGYGESPKSTEVVTDSCKNADIIVAVTSIKSPNLDTVSTGIC